ncbi:hypothetical protein [Wenxinia saemankumensis]|uniref:Metal binding domain of Ada n=1 Tax=Wenxinia saemankumensis TaxID=1447782 RepID=A0A1M6ALT5_9RHOB|nr:hypothetical protein [Wenxinia saemankumensis]SHI37469.1 hypothetical protein SAMN05444417_0508 [Wenxinia saemankumensis]
MGNRGILHDAEGRMGPALWRHRAWIACRLDFGGRRRRLMAPGAYTELFFHDEAVALAAGHRPCAECRRADHLAWRAAWADAFGTAPTAPDMDAILHAARAHPGARRMRRWEAETADLPDGTFLSLPGGPALLWEGAALPFAPGGYAAPQPRPTGRVTVLTPEPAVRVLRAGYVPQVIR